MEFGGETPEHVVISLIVSDGDPSHSQRDQLFDNNFRVVGLVGEIEIGRASCRERV